MASTKVYDICIPHGETKQRDGTFKRRWKNLGSVWKSANGNFFVLLDPTVDLAAFERKDGKSMLAASLFKPRNAEKQDREFYE